MAFSYYVTIHYKIYYSIKLIYNYITQNVPGSDGKVEKLKGSDKILPSLIGVVSVFLVCQVRPPAKLIITLALCL